VKQICGRQGVERREFFGKVIEPELNNFSFQEGWLSADSERSCASKFFDCGRSLTVRRQGIRVLISL
jgi:hypothetical protein